MPSQKENIYQLQFFDGKVVATVNLEDHPQDESDTWLKTMVVVSFPKEGGVVGPLPNGLAFPWVYRGY